MFISRIALVLLLLVSSFAHSNTPAQPQMSQEELELVAQIERAMVAIRQVGGLYIVNIEQMPSKNKVAIIKALTQAAKSKNCDELFEMPEPHTIVFKGAEGKKEAEALIKELEKLGCTAEFLELN